MSPLEAIAGEFGEKAGFLTTVEADQGVGQRARAPTPPGKPIMPRYWYWKLSGT